MIKNQNNLIDHVVSQGEGNIVSDMDGEKVMLSVQNGKYYNLGEVGGEIWDRIKVPIRTIDLIDLLLQHYDVGKEACEEQVLYFLNLLSDEGLINVEELSS